jgi:hypothetical protein
MWTENATIRHSESVGFEILMAVAMETAVFWFVRPCTSEADVSEEHITSILRTEYSAKQETSKIRRQVELLLFVFGLLFDLEDGGDMLP